MSVYSSGHEKNFTCTSYFIHKWMLALFCLQICKNNNEKMNPCKAVIVFIFNISII